MPERSLTTTLSPRYIALAMTATGPTASNTTKTAEQGTCVAQSLQCALKNETKADVAESQSRRLAECQRPKCNSETTPTKTTAPNMSGR